MKPTKTDKLERVIAAQNLVEIGQILFAQINPIPRVLTPGEQVIPNNVIVYGYTPMPRTQGWHHTGKRLVEPTELARSYLTIEQQTPIDWQYRDGHTRERYAKYAPATETALVDVAVQINTNNIATALSPYVIYCAKTGQPIGAIFEDVLINTLQLHGQENLARALYLANCNAVHPAWQKTGSAERYNEVLDKLCDNDPRAYAVYCLGLISKPKGTSVDTVNQWAEYHWSLARAWQILELLPAKDLPALCDSLMAILMYSNEGHSLRCLQHYIGRRIHSADLMARYAIEGQLLPAIDKALEATFQIAINWKIAANRAMYEERPRAIADVARGPSQIRRQRKAVKRHLNDQLRVKEDKQKAKYNAALQEFGALASEIERMFGVPGKSMTERFARDGLVPSVLGPNNLALEAVELDLDEFADTLIQAHANSVERRTITWAELAEMNKERFAQEQAEKAHREAELLASIAPVMTMTERLARRTQIKPLPVVPTQFAQTKPIISSTPFARFNRTTGKPHKNAKG